MPLTPKNRKEEWLQGLVDHETTLTPKNRPEEWMKEIIDASGGGGGGGESVLFVTDNEGTLNKTWKEINDAAATGIVIWHESEADNDYYHFLGHTFYDNVEYWLEFDMSSNDSIYFKAPSQTDYPVMHEG